MRLMIVAGSQRHGSRSAELARVIGGRVETLFPDATVDAIDLGTEKLPYWDEDFPSRGGKWGEVWTPVSNRLARSDGFVVIAPEWNGMVPPALRNLFHLCNAGELAHKPGLIVSVSGGAGGAYPVTELRSSSYKNTHICWIPEHVIVRNAESTLEALRAGFSGQAPQDRVADRIDYALRILHAYMQALVGVRAAGIIDHETFRYGMS